MVSGLTRLPFEVLAKIFILSSNPQLPVTCRFTFHMLYHAPDDLKVAWLLYRHGHILTAACEAALKFPFFSMSLLERFDRLYARQQQQPDAKILFTKKMVPPQLFSKMDAASDALAFTLLERGASPNKPHGYPLIKSAQLGRLDIVKQLITFGADPTVRQNMALRVCAARDNREMVLYFLDHLQIKPDSESLRACVQKGLWDMVKLLVDHGAVPDMNTVNFT
ncbi:uncharacterized protein BYT42DRAFT_547720 [Radiomyces spectabilis]|uniref:uncharacterized protein n=1 Tax=Radiomyces spectabilis TaxID=64574 RepID=UPI00221E70D6|nr:uncharacterized protein BYT42DRAFT_547720 [Radiomyces spectabilis]KAI8374726.1 hypothetical protein BYT42DRAFT_547720 [Radiomyces spectabilis]